MPFILPFKLYSAKIDHMLILTLIVLLLGTVFSEDLYSEFVKEQVKEIPLKKAVIVGKGDNKLITFINPDCPHCRQEWKELRPYLHKLKVYVFLLPTLVNSGWEDKVRGLLKEEIPQAYKDVTEVVKVVDALGIAKLVARLKPIGTLKG